MPYEYIEDAATADIAFRATHPTLEGVFAAAADATVNVMVKELETIQPAFQFEFRVESSSLEMLLHDLLQELIYYKDAEMLFLRIREVRIDKAENHYILRATAAGERVDPERHPTGVDVKAVTMHQFSLVHGDAGWEAFVILDI